MGQGLSFSSTTTTVSSQVAPFHCNQGVCMQTIDDNELRTAPCLSSRQLQHDHSTLERIRQHALQVACQTGHTDVVRFLLEYGGVDPNNVVTHNHHHMSILEHAVAASRYDVCRVLLHYGAQADTQCPARALGLLESRDRGESSSLSSPPPPHWDMVRLLLSYGAPSDASSDDASDPPPLLHRAIDDRTVLEFLLRHHGAEIVVSRVRDASRSTLWHVLARDRRHHDTLLWALRFTTRHGGRDDDDDDDRWNLNAINAQEGATALHLLVDTDLPVDTGVVRALLLRQPPRADAVRDVRGRTAFHVAAFRRQPDEVLETLLRHGRVDVNARDGRGNTALHLVVDNAYRCCRHIPLDRSMAVMRCLLRHGADTCVTNEAGLSPLLLACLRSRLARRRHCGYNWKRLSDSLGLPKTCCDVVFLLVQASSQHGELSVVSMRHGA